MTAEPRIHRWVQAEDGGPLWRHGRAHCCIRGVGIRGYPDGTGPRHDIQLSAEWRVLPARNLNGFGWGVKWGTNASETTPDLALHLSKLGDLWLHFGGVVLYRWLERHHPDGRVDYDTRVFGVTLAHDHFEWDCWARAHHWSRSDPWWMHQYRTWRTLFFGRDDTTTEVVASGTCVVPMPEANYPATYEITYYEHRHRGPLGRLRDWFLGPRHHDLTIITLGSSVPVPGKAENSWDCGDDAISSTSIRGSNVEKAIAALVESSLTTRRRHGGQHMSIPQ